MVDSVSPEVRSRIMRRVKCKNTGLEMAFRRALWASGIRGWRCHDRSVAGTPDLVWKSRRIAVFLDSAWWHGHPSRWRPGRHPGKWDEKLARNVARDAEVTQALLSDGWIVLRFWDFEVEKEPDRCVDKVRKTLAQAGRANHRT